MKDGLMAMENSTSAALMNWLQLMANPPESEQYYHP